jgi:hypothetical protein
LPTLSINPAPPWHVTDQLLFIAGGFPAGATVFFYMRFAGYTWTIGTNSAGDNGVAYFVYTVPKTIDSYSLVNQTVGFVAFNPAVGETNTVSGLVTIYPPNFRVTGWAVPLYAPPGSSVTISYTITNQGEAGTEILTVADVTRGVNIRSGYLDLGKVESRTFSDTLTMPSTDLVIRITLFEPVFSVKTDEKEFTISSKKLQSKLELRATDVNGNDITSGTAPLDIILRGRLTDAVNGWGLANRRVYIYENDVQIGYATTDAAGAFVMTVTRNRGTYTYYAEWAGDDTYEGC